MKKLIIATVIAGLFLTSCQKANRDELSPAATETTTAATAVTSSGWIPVTFSAGAQTGKGLTASTGSVLTTAVDNGILEDGLVLVFGKTDAVVNLLPFQGADLEWSYNVSQGEISIVAIGKKELSSASMLTVVIPSAKIAELEKTGYTRSDLLNIPYEKAQTLFNL